MKILIVEDNQEFSNMLSSFLREEGFETEAALSGKDGIKKALSFFPDLILLDYHLGDMTGYDVAMGIKYMRRTSEIPFVVLSSLGADPALINSFSKVASCRGTFTKTQPLAKILEAVHSALCG